MSKKVLLLLLDGWGITTVRTRSAIAQAHTPFIDSLYKQYPHSQLITSGAAVGLPAGQMGNSEVGHMTIGAGRVWQQPLARIHSAIASGSFYQNATLLAAMQYAKQHSKAVHVLGLASDGGIHAHIHHLKALCTLAQLQGISSLWVHAFTDGRDADPHSGVHFLQELTDHMQATTGRLASIIGRYYAMDRDQRWGRTRVAYDLLVYGKGKLVSDWQQALQASYQEGISDEFMQPIRVVNKEGTSDGRIQAGDVVIFCNFRTDRGRQLTQVLTQEAMPSHAMWPLPLHYLTMTTYDPTFQGVQAIFEQTIPRHTLGEVLSQQGKQQLRIAETEKYPHVTYFFSGGWQVPFAGEQRILCPSPKVPTYDVAPEMSAYQVTERVVPVLAAQHTDFICLNFANADMVGHTGVWSATVKACEVIDQCVKKVVEAALHHGYTTLLTADHGNAEVMYTKQGAHHTQHTTNPVPFLLIDPRQGDISLRGGQLADIAPTILQMMGLSIPVAMTGQSLINR